MKNVKKIINECIKKYINESFDTFDDETFNEYLDNLNQISTLLSDTQVQLDEKIENINKDIESCKSFLDSLDFNLKLSNNDLSINGVTLTYEIEGSENWNEEEANNYSQLVEDNFISFKESLDYDSNLYIGLDEDDISTIYVVITHGDDEDFFYDFMSNLNNKIK